MQEATQQIDDTLITNAMIRYSEARAPFSLVEVIRHYALPLLVIGLVIIAAIVIVFLRYRRQVNLFNKHQAAAREALQTALDAADNASAAKTSFLSNMSHDIRTPLNAIIGMTAIAGANIGDTNRVKDCLSKIASSGKHLLSLINEILDVSKDVYKRQPAASASTSLSTASRPDSAYSGVMPKSLSMICVDSHTTSSSSTMSTGKLMNSSYTLSSSSAIFRNTVAVNVEPLPSSLSTSISPFIMRAAESAIGMPSPCLLYTSGHLHIGKEAPEKCPVCAHPQSHFEIRATNY